MLKKISNSTVKMRQVVVDENIRGLGIGKKMVQYAENWSKHLSFSMMTLHARQNVVDFYLALDYIIEGDEFIEVGIPHYAMKKRI